MILFALVCYLLAAPLIGRLFYPFHYRDKIYTYAEKYQVDPILVAAVIYTESGFRSNVISRRGAMGLMQVMPTTAEWIAGKIGLEDFSTDMLLEPECNIEIGTWYLADLARQFGGNRLAVLAAYNGGRGSVSQWLERGIWDGSAENLEQIPFSETRTFVRRAEDAYLRYRELYDE